MSTTAGPAPRNRAGRRRLVAAAVSLGLLAALLATVDLRALGAHFATLNPWWMLAAVLLFVPQIAAISHRWARIAAPVARIGDREACRQVLAASCLNLVLPAKLGDLAKGVFLFRAGRCSLGDGLQIVVFEKLLDLAALSAWMLLGWMLLGQRALWMVPFLALGAAIIGGVWTLYFTRGGAPLLMSLVPAIGPGKKIRGLVESAPRVAGLIHAGGGRTARLLAWSAAIWLLHLVQIWCFFEAIGATAGLRRVLAEMPVAIFAGLMPFTIAGVGVRDWAIVQIFQSPENSRALLAGVGLLFSLRYIVPALWGLPYAGRYFAMAKRVNSES